MVLRVLFADDQFPWDDDQSNASVKQAIIEEKGEDLRRKGKDPEIAFAEDLDWFKGLRRYLSERFELVPARTLSEAKDSIGRRKDFDIAVIDLSWSGDPALPLGERHNVGLQLLDALAEQNRVYNDYKPVIAFSQNFAEDPELMRLALDRGALPVPKHYEHTGQQALTSAIKYLAELRPLGGEPTEEGKDLTLARLVQRMPISQLWGLVTALAGAFVAIATAAYRIGGGRFPWE